MAMEGMGWVKVAQYKEQLQALVNSVMILGARLKTEFLYQLIAPFPSEEEPRSAELISYNVYVSYCRYISDGTVGYRRYYGSCRRASRRPGQGLGACV